MTTIVNGCQYIGWPINVIALHLFIFQCMKHDDDDDDGIFIFFFIV